MISSEKHKKLLLFQMTFFFFFLAPSIPLLSYWQLLV